MHVYMHLSPPPNNLVLARIVIGPSNLVKKPKLKLGSLGFRPLNMPSLALAQSFARPSMSQKNSHQPNNLLGRYLNRIGGFKN